MDDTRKHLKRLSEVYVQNPIYFITICAHGRINRLANDVFHAIATEVWRNCEIHCGWSIGRYVIMTDHVHFFTTDNRDTRTLSDVIGKWKEWTAKYCCRRYQYTMPLWQPEFFDHVLRSSESYEQKWEYVRENPVRAGLVSVAGDWNFQGELSNIRHD